GRSPAVTTRTGSGGSAYSRSTTPARRSTTPRRRLRDAARTGAGPEPGAGLTEGTPLYPAGAGR
ncbi:hypothetical protein, partial [Streptomyces milbemycinicus]